VNVYLAYMKFSQLWVIIVIPPMWSQATIFSIHERVRSTMLIPLLTGAWCTLGFSTTTLHHRFHHSLTQYYMQYSMCLYSENQTTEESILDMNHTNELDLPYIKVGMEEREIKVCSWELWKKWILLLAPSRSGRMKKKIPFLSLSHPSYSHN